MSRVTEKTKVRIATRARKLRRGPLILTLAELQAATPSPVGMAAVEGMLDAIEAKARDVGLKGVAPAAMRVVFGMLLGAGIQEDATIEVEGGEPIVIRKADAQAVAMKSFVELTRLEVAHAVGKIVDVKMRSWTELAR